jgi:hypothetical protein
VEDDHVDRPGVQARQRVELTGTNRSIGLIPLMVHVRGRVRKDRFACRCDLKGAIPGALSPETLPSVALSLAGPVTGARRLNPIPSRTRPLNASALMVLCLKTRESRSSPGQPRTIPSSMNHLRRFGTAFAFFGFAVDAGWSSPVARQAHNLKVTGSNPVPATIQHTARKPRCSCSGAFVRIEPVRHLRAAVISHDVGLYDPGFPSNLPRQYRLGTRPSIGR